MALIKESIARVRGSASVRGISYLGISQVVAAGSSFLLTLALTHLLSRDAYGMYRYVLAAAGTLGAFTLTGYATALLRETAGGGRALSKGARTVCAWSVPAMLGAVALAGYYALQGNHVLAWSLALAGLTLPATAAWSIASSYLSGMRRFGSAALALNLGDVVTVGGVIAVAFLTRDGGWTTAAYLVLAMAGAGAGYAVALRRDRGDGTPHEDTLSYARHLSAMNILGLIATQIDRLFAFHYLGAESLAVYAIAIAFPEQAKGLAKVGLDVLLARFSGAAARGDTGGGAGRTLAAFIVGCGAMMVAYVVVAPFVVPLFFPAYADAVPYSQVFALSLPAVAVFVPQSWLQAHKKTSALYQLNVATSVIQIGLMLLGVLAGGLWGLVLARVASRYINFAAFLVAQRKAR